MRGQLICKLSPSRSLILCTIISSKNDILLKCGNIFATVFIAVSISTVSIQLIPLSRQASSWNRCLKKTTETLKLVKAVRLMDDKGKEVIAVMICNGAVFEPKINTNIK